MKHLAEAFRNNKGFLFVLAIMFILNVKFDFYYVRTGSMEPAVQAGGVVAVNPSKIPEPGDIAVYSSGSILIVHRVIHADENGFIFQGDNNPNPDPYVVSNEDIRGTVIFRVNAAAPVLNAIAHVLDNT